jgi:hypothetical protein
VNPIKSVKRAIAVRRAKKKLADYIATLSPQQQKVADAMSRRLREGGLPAYRAELWRIQGEWAKVQVQATKLGLDLETIK